MTQSHFLLAHTDITAAQDSAREVQALGHAAIRLLRSCVEQGEVFMARESQSALALEAAGFVTIHQGDRWMEKPFQVRPTLAGEEALLALDGELGEQNGPLSQVLCDICAGVAITDSFSRKEAGTGAVDAAALSLPVLNVGISRENG